LPTLKDQEEVEFSRKEPEKTSRRDPPPTRMETRDGK
jgi:hypothetical protein